MPRSARTFRIFVSSTFSDLVAERNALQERVFPRLRELAQQHGARFQVIDLRWGVSEEASLDQQAMNICLGEVDRCRQVSPKPNFLILLGDRFGWRTLPYAIAAAEFERLPPHLTETERALVCWREDQSEDMLNGWYRLDDNAAPAEYVLQPRHKGSRFEDYDTWMADVERPLVTALEHTARRNGMDADALSKYTLSATGQEIEHGVLRVKDAQEHVFGFFREIANPDDMRDPGRSDPAGVARRGHTGRRGDTGNITGPDLRRSHERLSRSDVYEFGAAGL